MKLFDRLGKLRDRRRPYCTMIVPAAGESRRMGGGNKLLLPLEGEPVLAHTLRAIDAATLVDEIILSTRTECLTEMAELCRRCGLQKPVRVVVGGETRTHSVLAAALEANEKARLIVWEMTERLALDLLEKRLAGDQVVLDVGYDIDNLTDPEIRKSYSGPVVTDRYGRQTPKPAHGSENLGRHTASAKIMTEAMLKIFDRIAGKNLLVRRITVTACHVLPESQISEEPVQLDLFSTTEEQQEKLRRQEAELERERRRQQAVLSIQRRYGRNAILRGSNYLEGATARERNGQIGGHKA